jgi:hypothetical protein
MNALTLVAKLFVAVCTLAGFLLAQPSLRITSPVDGTIVHPGESLTVTVDVFPPEGAFQAVLVAGFEPIGLGKQALKAPPYRFTVQIPDRIKPGRYPITALGSTGSAQLLNSDPVVILVERADSPISISVYPPMALDFTMGQKRYLQVTGTYADKTTADLTKSSRISYVSSAPGVAKVDAQGIVTPVAPGTAKITITYGDLKLEVPVKVGASRGHPN